MLAARCNALFYPNRKEEYRLKYNPIEKIQIFCKIQQGCCNDHRAADHRAFQSPQEDAADVSE